MGVSRRRFLKGTAVAAGALAADRLARLPGTAAGGPAYAAAVGERLEDFYDIDPDVERFQERNSLFHRTRWDPVVQEWLPLMGQRMKDHISANDPGYRAIDYAMRTAGWAVVDLTKTGTGAGTRPGAYHQGLYQNRPVVAKPPASPVRLSPDEAARAVKKVARFLGADLVGITELDPRWVFSHYAHRQMPLEGPVVISDEFQEAGIAEDGTFGIPASMRWVISLALKHDLDVVRGGTTAVASAAVGKGYLDQAVVAYGLAEFLWALGYRALPSGNDLAISGVFAVAAGLGELGRNGIVVTPEHGPNVRLAKVFTDLPMTIDKPRNFGVREFCKSCRKCAEHCPSGAIPTGEMTKGKACMSNTSGVLKWSVDVEKCFKFWNENGVDCANCMAVCPYTKDSRYWQHALGVKLAPVLGSAFVALDDLLGYGQTDPLAWWNMH